MSQITIAGLAFNVEPRYSEGHVLTASEASVLNQTLFENLRNNFASRVAEAKEAGNTEGLQASFDEYASQYQFGIRVGGGGRSGDPIRTEAMNMAREAVRSAIRQKGLKVSEYAASQITAAAEKYLEKYPETLEKARERVEAMRSQAGVALDDDLLSALATPATEENGNGSGQTDGGVGGQTAPVETGLANSAEVDTSVATEAEQGAEPTPSRRKRS